MDSPVDSTFFTRHRNPKRDVSGYQGDCKQQLVQNALSFGVHIDEGTQRPLLTRRDAGTPFIRVPNLPIGPFLQADGEAELRGERRVGLRSLVAPVDYLDASQREGMIHRFAWSPAGAILSWINC